MKHFCHCLPVSRLFVLNSFIKRSITKFTEAEIRFLRGQISKPYNNIGIHFDELQDEFPGSCPVNLSTNSHITVCKHV